jgi:hypothetical protein
MMSDTDRAVIEFRDTWPGDIAGRSDIIRFIDGAVNEMHLTHAIKRAGMVNAQKRITVATMGPFKTKDSVVIVKPAAVSLDDVRRMSSAELRTGIENARADHETRQLEEANR